MGRESRSAVGLTQRGPVQLLELQQELQGATSVQDLFTRVSDSAPAECGFSRAVMLEVEGRTLTARLMGALHDVASDRLRRTILAQPVELATGSIEAEFVRLVTGGRREVIDGRSVLKERYGVEDFALGAVAPEGDVLALLMVDRPAPAVTAEDRTIVQLFAQLVAWSLERVIRQERAREVSGELQYMMTSAAALLAEGSQGPVGLPVETGFGPVFSNPGARTAPGYAINELRELLTRRELSIAREVVTGKTNREIAESLQLSPDTVKKHVSRVLQKLGVSNRAEAAATYARSIDTLSQ